jgi:hypothetical protein
MIIVKNTTQLSKISGSISGEFAAFVTDIGVMFTYLPDARILSHDEATMPTLGSNGIFAAPETNSAWWSGAYGFTVLKNDTQTITTSDTALAFNVFDSNSYQIFNESSTVFEPQITGIYNISFMLAATQLSETNSNRQVHVMLRAGSTVLSRTRNRGAAMGGISGSQSLATLSTRLELIAGTSYNFAVSNSNWTVNPTTLGDRDSVQASAWLIPGTGNL